MKNIILSFFAVFILTAVTNCSSTRVNNQHYQREWMMVSFDKFTKQELIENEAGINLTGEKTGTEISGTAKMGCNRFFFKAELKNKGKIKISGLGGTEMACAEMELENTFMKRFVNMTRYKIEGHRLMLSDDLGNEMKFIAADWD
jgi:heat shock protein HslJ